MRNITHPEASGYTGARRAAANSAADAAPDETAKCNHLLAAMRVVRAQLLLAKNEVDYIGIALKGGFITTDHARDWLEEIDAWPLIDAVLGGTDE